MFDFTQGEVILIDKPLEWTSYDVIKYIKPAVWTFEEKKIGIRHKIKIGHAGTLDPLATGLLVICTGKKTKSIDTIQQQSKTYTGTFRLGATTPSFDRETDIDEEFSIQHITDEMILNTAKQFIGVQMQVPPIHSAVNINGKRAYQLARKNIEVELAAKPIEIYTFEITQINLPHIQFMVKCSKGTYIRSLARDFGRSMNSGAYLYNLRRETQGDFNVQNAMQIKEFVHLLKTTPTEILK